jgi:hypothetical protein
MAKKPKLVETPEGESNKSPRRKKMEWQKKPFCVVVGGSARVRASFASVDDAVSYVNKLSVMEQTRAYIGQFYPVNVRTTVELNKG